MFSEEPCSCTDLIFGAAHGPSAMSNMHDSTSKRLTVTFRGVDIVVHGLGEDFGSTCASVISDLIPFKNGSTSQRVSVLSQ